VVRRKRLQLQLQTSGVDKLIYFFNKNTSDIIPLVESSTKVNINPDDEIGLLGVFDTSETVAMTVNYMLSVIEDDLEDENEDGIAPIIIFVIVICSVFGFIIVIAACFYTIRAVRGSRKTLIRMNNEI
jgi:hypothetical protein